MWVVGGGWVGCVLVVRVEVKRCDYALDRGGVDISVIGKLCVIEQ